MSDSNPITSESLPDAIVRLVHYVELHRSGWWDRALDRLVLAALWVRAPISGEDLAEELSAALQGRLSRERVLMFVERERAAGNILQLPNEKLKLTEELHQSLTAEAGAVSDSEARVKRHLMTTASTYGITESDELWADFNLLFLDPLLRDSGARVYEFLTNGNTNGGTPTYGAYVDSLSEKYGTGIRQALIDFLNPSNPSVREYILRRLNGAFVREAASLSQDVLNTIAATRGRPDQIRVLLDTNFVFSFLRLHDNPSNEVAADLVRLADEVKTRIKVDFFVLPITIEEIQRVIRDEVIYLNGLRPSVNLATAASRLNPSGLFNSYLNAASASGNVSLTPQDFFGPYESNTLAILRENGIELFNASVDALRTDQEVIDDLTDQEEVQKRVRKGGSKPYESNLHDMVLWHFARRQRPSVIGSPLDIGSWVCTIDYGFIAFDRHKRRGSKQPAICLSPSALIQLLQFWVPRSTSLDVALVGAIREPLLFLDFDREAEATTLGILRTLSRFENVGDLSVDSVCRILTNDALRTAIVLGYRGGEGIHHLSGLVR